MGPGPEPEPESKVTGYIPYSTGATQIFLFSLDSNLAGGCNVTNRYAITSNSAHFKGVQAAVMVAFHSQTTINLNYATSCNSFGNAWDITSICVGSIAC